MAIDLSTIIFRAHEPGDIDTPKNIPSVVITSTTPIILDSIKFRAKEIGDAEDEE